MSPTGTAVRLSSVKLYNGAQPAYDPALGDDCDVGEACRTFTMVSAPETPLDAGV